MRIVVTGDVQRPLPQSLNIESLYHLIRRQIEVATGEKVELFNQGEPLRFNAFVRDCANRSYNDEPAYQFQKLGKEQETIWICFEGNFNFIHQCEVMGIKYIDVWIHPVRFMRDLAFAVRSNFVDLSKFTLRHYEIENEAQLMKAAMNHRPGVRMKDNALLLIGQTEGDKSVIQKGKSWTLKDFKDKVLEEAEQHSEVIFKPHPAAPNLADEYREFIFKGTDIAVETVKSANVYRLLCQPQVAKVFALSSSVLEEARWFGKPTVNCLTPWWTNGYRLVMPEQLLSFGFWSRAFDGAVNVRKDLRDRDPVCWPNMLRNVFNSKWGYPF